MFGAVPPLESTQKIVAKPTDDVVTYEKQSITLGPRYNPDELVGRKGLAIYAKMRLDEQVKAVMNFKRDAITARGWSFKYEDDSSLSEKERARRCHVFESVVCGSRGSFVDALNLISTGRDFGLSLTEKIYSDITVDGQTYIGISEFRGRDPSSFEFYTDDFGTLNRVVQNVSLKRIEIDMSRMIHYVHSPEFDPFYGRSDLREAYRAWYAKDRLVVLWLNYLERMAGGLIQAVRGPNSNMTQADITALQEVLKNAQGAMGVIMPMDTKLEVSTPPTTDAYEKAATFMDLAIARSLLVPNLLGVSHTGQTGSYSQSDTQLMAFLWTLNADAARLEACINEQLIKDLGDQNFGDGEYPEFCFKPASMDQIMKVLDGWTKLITGKAVIATEEDEAHIRKLLEMPKRDEKSTPLIDPVVQQNQEMAQQAQDHSQQMAQNADARAQAEADRAAKQAQTTAYTRMTEEFTALKGVIAGLQPRKEPEGAAGKEAGRVVPHGKLRMASMDQFNLAVRRVNFTVIEKQQDRMAEDLTSQVAAFTAKGVKKLLGTDAELAKLIDIDTSDIPGVEFSGFQKGKLKDLYRKSLASAWTLGGSLARNELDRARGQRLARMTDLRDKAGDFFEVNGFRMAGNVSDGIKAVIQQELQNSVKLGRTAKDTREVIWDRLVSRGFTNQASVLDTEDDPIVVQTLKDLWGVGERQTAAYLDTLSRTNLFEAMNEARYAEFTDPELGGFVQALEYSAILDDRTTEICQALNGQVYAEDSDVWNEIRPPNHYNAIPAGTPITTDKGVKVIEEIRVGDRVLTHKGRYRPVTEAMHHDSWPEEILLEFEQGHQFVCTPDHPILTERGWVCAGDIRDDDVVMSFPRNGKTRYCKGCGEKIPGKGKKKAALYCSQDCMGKAMRHIPVKHCEQCHKPMVSKWKTPMSRERRFCSQSCYFGFKGETSIERTVREWLAESHIQAKPQYMFGRYTVDFFLPDFQMAVECDGDYWHTTMEKPLTKRMARNALLVEYGVRQVRLTQAQIESGEFKKILSEAMTHADHEAAEHQVSNAATV